MNRQLALIEAIARQVDPEIAPKIREHLRSGQDQAIVDACDVLLGALDRQQDIAAIVGPTGPELAASQLHEWVWSAAAKQWDDGHRRDAIQRACTTVFDQELRSKVQRYDMKTSDLLGLVFNVNEPRSGEVRLRIPGFDKGTP